MYDCDPLGRSVARRPQMKNAALHYDLARGWLFNAGQQPHQCGLSGAVLSNEDIDGCPMHTECHMIERGVRAITLGHVSRFQHEIGMDFVHYARPAESGRRRVRATAFFQPAYLW